MKQVSTFLFIFLVVSLPEILSQDQKELKRSVYLIGNAANVSCDAPILVGLRNMTAVETAPYTLIYLGDIIDDDGLEKEDCEGEKEKLQGLIEIARNNPLGNVFFVPGERDWDDAGKSGLKKVKRLEKFLEEELQSKRVLIPTKGCPGPMAVDVGENLRIIAINTQWFLHPYERPEESDVDCDMFDVGEFWDELDDFIEGAQNRNVIVVGHHPAFSYGQYAGYKSLRKHFFPLTEANEKLYIPLPVLGTFYAAYRKNVGTNKDLTNEKFETYIKRLERIFQEYENLIYVSAHELDLQALYVDENFHLNSGSMEKGRAVAQGPETIFRQSERGFLKLEFYNDGAVGMKAFNLDKNELKLTYDQLLMASACDTVKTEIPINDRFAPCLQGKKGEEELGDNYPTSITMAPGPHYEVSKLRRWIFGEHYRKTWVTEIANVPILDLDTTFGGLVPFARGGGGQSHVLKFQAGDGQWYYFRSVDKDPTVSMSTNKDLIEGVYGDLLKDLTSGQYPYGAFVTDKLMDAAKIRHPKPKLYVMPDDPKLGIYREQFAHMFGMLQIRPRGNNKGVEGFQDADRIVKTVRMFQYLLEDNDHQVDAPSYAKARLFDLLVADWDRQADNWKFMGYGDKKAMTFYAMPKDRDRAFSKWEGIYWLVDREFGSPKIAHFGYGYGDYKTLTFKARNIDRMILNEMTFEQWMDIAKELQRDLNDELIAEAVAEIPPEARAVSGTEISGKLKARRDKLIEATHVFYHQLAEYVDIIGSNKREIYEVERFVNGDVKVEVFKKKKSGEKDKLLYSKVLKKNETKEIRLHGLGKQDEFHIKGEADRSILVRVIGGDGRDLIADRSKVKGLRKHTKIYDKSGKDTLHVSKEAKLVDTKKPIEFTYQMYNPHTYMPLPSLIYNKDDGFGAGFGLTFTRQGFNKPGFAKKYHIKAAATTRESFWLIANSEFRHAVGEWDLHLSGKVSNAERSFRNFYGIGNETVKDDALTARDFYENNTNTQRWSTGLVRQFWRRSSFKIAAEFERNSVSTETGKDIPSTIYETIPNLLGLGTNSFLGSFVNLDLDFTDAAYLPSQGVRLQVSHRYFFNLSDEDQQFRRFTADMRFYETIPTQIPITLSLRGGYALSTGDVPFYYLSHLGQRDNLRGFLRNRFSGEEVVYFNNDLRFDLGTIKTAVVPVGIGAFGFIDLGQVRVDGQDSDQWHSGYGGGLYLAPLNDNFNITFSAASSAEEKLLFEFSFGFNL